MIKKDEYYMVKDRRLSEKDRVMLGIDIICEFIKRGYTKEDILIDDPEDGPYWIPGVMSDDRIQEELSQWDIELDY